MSTPATTPTPEAFSVRYEDVMLPSKGLCYPKEWTKDGKISLKPMTLEEEKILTTARLAKSGRALDMIFKACLENKNIDTTELLSGDRNFLLFFLRAMSYGANYDYEIKCPSCDFNPINMTYNLNDIIVKYLREGFKEPISVELPMSKLKISFRLSRGKDELRLIDERDRRLAQFSSDAIDNTVSERLSLVITSINGEENRIKIDSTINKLIAGDAAYLREVMTQEEPGLEAKQEIICPRCSYKCSVDVPIGSSFFSVSKKRS